MRYCRRVVFVNEWLPNPAGPDAPGEFAELLNGGPSAVDLAGWRIVTEKGKTFALGGRSVPPRGFLLLTRRTTGLTLRNSDGGLLLYAPDGALEDRAAFQGSAPEGKSFSRANYDSGPEAHFVWASPTPGAPNALPAAPVVETSVPAFGTPLGAQFTAVDFFAIMIGAAALTTGLIFHVIKKHEDLSKLFSGRNGAFWKVACDEGESIHEEAP